MHKIAIHLALIVGIATLLVSCVVYPFLPGGYDRLAVPLSTMAQVFGVVGLALVPGGLLWLIMPRLGFAISVWSTAVGTCVALILALFATLSVGNSFGVLTLAAWVYVLAQLMPRLKRLRRAEGSGLHPAPVYLVCLPVLALAAQLLVAAPMARASRDRAIANASPYIADIEQYHARHGRYPVSLQAQNRDYHADIVGVERYIYVSQGDSYNLSFEQPRFLLTASAHANGSSTIRATSIGCIATPRGSFRRPRWRSRVRAGTLPARLGMHTGCISCSIEWVAKRGRGFSRYAVQGSGKWTRRVELG